jgi:gamma-glutamyltranspeptidase/glutathione hydrolase
MPRIKSVFSVCVICLAAGFSLFSSSVCEAGVDLERDAFGKRGMVAAATPEASEIGVEILKKGGNAVDAAVAVGFALGVLEPNASGLGGGGFMMIHLAKDNKTVFLDFREKAPLKAAPDMYKLGPNKLPLNNANKWGPLSVAVPGEVAGLLFAQKNYGAMSRKEVMAPAIKWAEQGVEVTPVMAGLMTKYYDALISCPATADIYLDEELPKMPGDVIKNFDLAKTLKLIAQKGRDAFYKGPLARKIVDFVRQEGGIISLKDLADYQVSQRQPVKGSYRGYEILSAAPPSSGGTHVIELLNIMENTDLKKLGKDNPLTWHLWAEAMKLIYADRARYSGDTDYAKVPLNGLLSKAYAKGLFERIDQNKVVEKPEPGDPWKYESASTTHYSVMDSQGNMVAVTKTLNFFFGSGLTVPGTGILLNDEMADFDFRPGQVNSIAPGKRPLSSMSPTLVLKDGESVACLGSPGGKRIITTVALIISNLLDHGLDLQAAINAPRISQYHQGPFKYEKRLPRDVLEKLKQMGHELEEKQAYDLYFGGAQGVYFDRAKARLHGAADPRRDGRALGF